VSAEEYPRVQLKTVAELHRWLRDNHAKAPGLWLVGYRSATKRPAIAYDDAVEEALCWGWIDSVVKPVDDERTMSLYTPRRAGSGWSRSNKERVARLVKAGRMQPAGLAKIEQAKRDGSWTLLDSVDALTVPDDLRKALGATGMKRFDALTPGRKKEHLLALVTAKRPETRSKRLAAVVKTVRG
jgi:uncharacterized protein YdeI (YjbR/CyaY-like superfamily)